MISFSVLLLFGEVKREGERKRGKVLRLERKENHWSSGGWPSSGGAKMQGVPSGYIGLYSPIKKSLCGGDDGVAGGGGIGSHICILDSCRCMQLTNVAARGACMGLWPWRVSKVNKRSKFTVEKVEP